MISASVLPRSVCMTRSVSVKSMPSALAASTPTVDLPAPGMPISTTFMPDHPRKPDRPR